MTGIDDTEEGLNRILNDQIIPKAINYALDDWPKTHEVVGVVVKRQRANRPKMTTGDGLSPSS